MLTVKIEGGGATVLMEWDEVIVFKAESDCWDELMKELGPGDTHHPLLLPGPTPHAVITGRKGCEQQKNIGLYAGEACYVTDSNGNTVNMIRE